MAAIDELRRLHEVASGGQWLAADFHGVVSVRHERGYVTPEATRNLRYTDADKVADAALIAAMRNNWDALLNVAAAANLLSLACRAWPDKVALPPDYPECGECETCRLNTALARLEGGDV